MTGSAEGLSRLILELREKTGAGMMDCKKALAEAGGRMDEAMTALRKKGLAHAAKISSRATKEGLIAFASEEGRGALIELNCETDFVARTGDFGQLGAALARAAASGRLSGPQDAAPAIEPVFQKLRENIALRRWQRYEPRTPGHVAGYIHLGGKTGAMIEVGASSAAEALSSELKELAKELLFQIVALSPRFLDRTGVSAADVAREREIYTELLRKEGKLGKLFYQAFCLLEQPYVRDNKTPITALIEQAAKKLGGPAPTVRRFIRYQLGE